MRPPLLLGPRPATIVLTFMVGLVCSACDQGGGKGRGGPGGNSRNNDAAPGPERRVLIDSAVVESGAVADHLVTSGTLEGEHQADLFPEATGVVSKVYVEEGDPVKAGQVLALITNPSLDAGAQRATVDVSKAERTLEEAKRLHASGAISDKELQDAQDALALSQASYGEATKSRGFTQIDSPIAGTVAIRDLRPGELATSGKRAFQVVDLSKLRVVVQLPERDLPRVREGQSAQLTGAYDDEAQVQGTVSRISPVVDSTTGTVKVTVDVEPGQSAIRPGQYVKVRVEVDRHTDVLTIPRRALVWDDGEPVAWKVVEAPPPEAEETDEQPEEEKGFFQTLFADEEAAPEAEEQTDPWEGIPRRGVEKSRLEVGYIDTERVEVLGGLESGDVVVSVGNGGLRPETLVKLANDPDPPKDDPSPGSTKDGEGAEE